MKALVHALVLMLALVAASMAAGCGGDDDPKVDASPAADSAVSVGDGGMCGATDLYQVCAESSDCSSCLCHEYGTAGRLCSKTCDRDEDCPAPSGACNMMGICKRPQ